MEDCVNLSQIEAKHVINILEDCIIKLQILGHRLPVPAQQPDIVEYQTLEEKYGNEETKIRSESSPYPASMLKLQKDRALLEYILKEAVNELRSNNSFKQLQLKVTQFQKEHREERKLLTELIELSLTAPGLKKELATSKQRTQTQLRECFQTLAQVQDKVARVQSTGTTQRSLATRWEATREGQLDMKLTLAEEQLENKLEEVARETDIELRVHAELETFLEATIQDLNEQVEQWKEKFEQDKAEKEQKLAAMKDKREANMKQLQQLAELYRNHRKELKDYQKLRHQRQIALEKLRFENKTATSIQAWWRGVMVRRGLGPFKKKKKPVKDKTKKK